MARAGASKFAALDRWLATNGDALRAACRAGKISYIAAVALLRLLTQKSKDGKFDQTYEQIETAMGGAVSRAQIERALKVLTGLGVLQTVVPARSGGRNGGKGRAPVRRLSFLVAADIETEPPAVPVDNPKWSRTKSEMTPHLSADPYGSLSTETPLRAANAEPSSGHRGAGKQAKREQGRSFPSSFHAQVCEAAAEDSYRYSPNDRVTNHDAVKAKRAKTALEHLIELERDYPRLATATVKGNAWWAVVEILSFLLNGKSPHPNAYGYLDDYKDDYKELAPTN